MDLPGPAYRIVTQRLVIRCWAPTDAPLLKTAIDTNLEHLRPWMIWAKQEPTSLEQKIKFLRACRGDFDLSRDFGYAVFNLDESRVLGGSGLHTRLGREAREIGYWIDKDHLNQGLATEVAGALTRIAFEVDKVHRVEIHCDPRNLRSAAVPRKLGFQHEATLQGRDLDTEGQPRSTMIWTLFASDYPSTPSASLELQAFDVIFRRLL